MCVGNVYNKCNIWCCYIEPPIHYDDPVIAGVVRLCARLYSSIVPQIYHNVTFITYTGLCTHSIYTIFIIDTL